MQSTNGTLFYKLMWMPKALTLNNHWTIITGNVDLCTLLTSPCWTIKFIWPAGAKRDGRTETEIGQRKVNNKRNTWRVTLCVYHIYRIFTYKLLINSTKGKNFQVRLFLSASRHSLQQWSLKLRICVTVRPKMPYNVNVVFFISQTYKCLLATPLDPLTIILLRNLEAKYVKRLSGIGLIGIER